MARFRERRGKKADANRDIFSVKHLSLYLGNVFLPLETTTALAIKYCS